jgi:uncharacterized Zn finger protein (UPF0148 family)
MKTQCPLCGFKFDKKEVKGCRMCPSFMKCGMVMCPKCGYEFPKI